MRLRDWMLLSVLSGAGCVAESEEPVRPARPDAAEPEILRGVLCSVSDLRFPSRCDPAEDLTGVLVSDQSGTVSTSTDAEGVFELELMDSLTALIVGDRLGARRSGLFSQATASRLGYALPTMARAEYDDLTSLLEVVEPDDSSSIVIYVRESGLPAAGVQVAMPAGSLFVLYDSDIDPLHWTSQTKTSSSGAIWILAVPSAEAVAELALVRDSDPMPVEVEVPVIPDVTTFVVVDL